MLEPRRAPLHDEPTRPSGRGSQYRVSISDAAVADPLFQSVDFVAGDAASVHHSFRRAFESTQITSRVRFGGAVGKQQSFIRDAAQPKLFFAPESHRRRSDRCPEMWPA